MQIAASGERCYLESDESQVCGLLEVKYVILLFSTGLAPHIRECLLQQGLVAAGRAVKRASHTEVTSGTKKRVILAVSWCQ